MGGFGIDWYIIRIQTKMSCVVKKVFYAAQAIYIHYRVVQSDNTLVIRSVRLEHETQAKYETYSCSNTDANVRF